MQKRQILSLSLAIIFCTTLLVNTLPACSRQHKKGETILTASISPIKYIIEYITCGDFPVEILVPEGANPESYSPSAIQLANIERSKIIFTSGLIDFEQELANRLTVGKDKIADLSKGISLREGACQHGHSYSHGTDPHIWTSPEQLKIMASNAYQAILKQFPDSLKYENAYKSLINKLDSVSVKIAGKLAAYPTRTFIIYHPALTYYAADYGMEQISLEDEGKEPSAAHIENVIKLAREKRIKYILYQKQFPVKSVTSLAGDIGAVPAEIDPLKENILDEILRITDIITAQ